MASDELREFILQYKAELEDLTANVKISINTLSQLADEWKERAAPSIAALVEKRLLTVSSTSVLGSHSCFWLQSWTERLSHAVSPKP